MSAPEVQVLERPLTRTLLGMRFRDAVTGAQVRDGLGATARPLAGGRPSVAFRTRSDIYAFARLDGLGPVERGEVPLDFDGSPGPAQQRFVVTVDDRLGRYLPLTLLVDLPLRYPGLYLEDDPAPPGGVPMDGVRLYRAPAFQPEPWIAAVRGELFDIDRQVPAAHARLRVRLDDGPARDGFADDAGRFLVMAPLPPALADLGASPAVIPEAVSERRWSLSLAVDWDPGAWETPPGASVPDQLSLLQQAPASILTDTAGPGQDSWSAQVRFRVPLVARTLGQSRLLIAATPSSPPA
jgi:hypothetical protein